MTVSKQMSVIISEIAKKYGVDLTQPGAWLKLELGAGWMPLVIEHIGRNLISVAHYYQQNGDLVPDPEIVFYTGDPAGWVPVECQLAIGTRTVCARVTNGILGHLNRAAALSVADFADMWADNIRDQGWLAEARKTAGTEAA